MFSSKLLKKAGTALKLFCALIFASCHLISFETLTVETSVLKGNSYPYINEGLFIIFSNSVDEESAEKCISLQKDGKSVSFRTDWNEYNAEITPKEEWTLGEKYCVTVSGNIKTKSGLTFSVSEKQYFIYGNQNELLEVMLRNTDSIINKTDSLYFDFSKPVSTTEFCKNFSISPYVTYKAESSEDKKTIKLTPENGWNANQYYEWKIDKSIKAADGYILKNEKSGSFCTWEDKVLPCVSAVCPAIKVNDSYTPLWESSLDLLCERDAILFSFSKPMDYSSVKKNISFTPDIQGSFYENITTKDFIFIPEEFYRPEQEYKIVISKSIADLSGLKMLSDQKIFFTSSAVYLEVLKIISGSTELNLSRELNEISSSVCGVLSADIYFSSEISPEYRNNACESVSCSLIFPSTVKSPVLCSMWWNESGSILHAVWENISSSSTEDYVYEICIQGGTGGVVNSHGEYLKEDLCVPFISR